MGETKVFAKAEIDQQNWPAYAVRLQLHILLSISQKDHIPPLYIELHWLPMSARIKFKGWNSENTWNALIIPPTLTHSLSPPLYCTFITLLLISCQQCALVSSFELCGSLNVYENTSIYTVLQVLGYEKIILRQFTTFKECIGCWSHLNTLHLSQILSWSVFIYINCV